MTRLARRACSAAMHCRFGVHGRSLPRLLSHRAFSTRGPTIAVHGGAWAIPDDLRQASLDGVGRATALGWEALTSNGSAVDAVEAAVRYLEEDPAFDAGRGAVLTSAGTVELDAVIMDGRDLSAGAVASLGPVLNPVSVARAVMERSEHVLLCGAGADAFAREIGVEASSADDLVTAAAREEYEQMKTYPTTVETLFNARAQLGHDTVGAVAVDADGNVAAATSTGGITFKRPGRVGDSPILGSGCLADNATGCISTTGHGESLMRFTFASRWAAAVDGGLPDAAMADATDPDAETVDAASIVDAMNNDRYEDVVNFARASLHDEAEPAEARMLWVDSLGFDVRVITSGALSGGSGNGKVLDVRLPFPAPATTTQRALSSLTMLAQTIWEEEKKYEPVLVPVEMPEKKDD